MTRYSTPFPSTGQIRTAVTLRFEQNAMRFDRLTLIVCFLCLFFFSSFNAFSQGRTLSPSTKVSKIALIDQSKLRKGYRAYGEVISNGRNDKKLQQEGYEAMLESIELQTKKQLKEDSLQGGQNRNGILTAAANKRNEARQKFEAGLKKLFNNRVLLLQELEKKITLAIDQVVAEGGYTDIQAVSQAPTAEKKGTDITALILKKLN